MQGKTELSTKKIKKYSVSIDFTSDSVEFVLRREIENYLYFDNETWDQIYKIFRVSFRRLVQLS
jgi:hypothetical protein